MVAMCSILHQANTIHTDISDTPIVRSSIDGPISSVAVSAPVLMSAAAPTTSTPADDQDGSVGASSHEAASGDVGLAIGLTVLVMLIIGAGVGGVVYVRVRDRPASRTRPDLATSASTRGDAPLNLVPNPSYSPPLSIPHGDDQATAMAGSPAPADV